MAWPPDTLTSAHTAGGQIHSPGRAYAHMPDDIRLAAAVVDAVIWDDPSWASSVLMSILGIDEPATSSRTQAFFEKRGWRDVADAYEAANVTKAQQRALELHLQGFTQREIGEVMETSGVFAGLQVYRALEKLRRACSEEPA